MLNRRKIRAGHDAFVACSELARYLYPYPVEGGSVERFRLVCEAAGVECEGEDLRLDRALELFAYLQGEIDEIFNEINRLYEQKVRKVS